MKVETAHAPRMKSHDCTRLSSSTIRLCAFAVRNASVCSHRYVATFRKQCALPLTSVRGRGCADPRGAAVAALHALFGS
eukprot:5294739-Prymnesium_polylepis.1